MTADAPPVDGAAASRALQQEMAARLTPRECEVLDLIGSGYETRHIAAALVISTKTVEAHKAHIKRKLGLLGASGLLLAAWRWHAVQGLGAPGTSQRLSLQASTRRTTDDTDTEETG